MNERRIRLDRLTTKLMVSLHVVTRTVSARRATRRSQEIPPRQWASRGRTLLPLLVYAVGFLIAESAAWLLSFALSPKIEGNAPLIVHSAVLVAALLLVPPKRWWIYLGLTAPLIVVNAWLFQLSPSWSLLWVFLLLYLGIVGLAVGMVSLLRRFVGVPVRFASVHEVSRFVLCACGAAIVPACVFTGGRIVIFDWTFWFSWETAYFGTVLAILVFTPAIVLWATTDIRELRTMARGRLSEVVLLALGLLVVSAFVFGVRYQGSGLHSPLIYLVVPLLLWAAVRFGLRGIASALALTTLVAISGATQGVGPFVGPTVFANVFALQLFLIFVGVPFFFLATVTQERAAADKALRASEARYRAVVETQTEMITRYRPDTTLTFVNDATCRFDGKMREELLGTSLLADMPEDEAARVREMIAALLAQPDPGIVTIEHQARAADGSLRWQQWVNRTILDSAGQVIELQGIGRDVTERKRAEEAQRESEARFRAAFESAAVGMALVGLDGHPLEVNHALVQMLGYSEQELRTQAFAEFTYSDDVEPNLTLFRQAVAGDIEHYHMEKRYLHKAGHLVWGHLSAGAVRDAMGEPLYLVVHLQDITEQKRAEQAVRDSEARYRAVVSNFPQGSVLLFGEDLRHIFADGPGLQADGPTRVGVGMGMEAKTVWEAFPPDVAGALELPYRAALDGRSASFDLTHDQHTYAVQVVPIRHSATRQGMVILQDVSEQRHSRDELERERTQAVLLRALSQEFRTLAEHSPDLIGRLDPLGRLVYINQAGAKLLGQPAEYWVGKTFADLGTPQAVFEPWAEALQEVITTCAPRTFDAEAQASDGHVRSLHTRFIPEFAEDGALVSVLGIATDVSALKRAEALLAEQASELESIFEAQADGVGVYDLQGRFVRANTALRELLGLDADPEYMARRLDERAQRLLLFDEQGQLLSSEQWPHWRVLRGEILAGANAMEGRVRTVDGRELWISTTGAPVYGPDGQVSGTVLITRDVTARRTLERQAAAQVAEQAAAAERTRLAHELHDTVTQEIYSAGLLADSITRNWQEHRAEAEQALMELPGVIRGALAGLRVLLLELRPATLDDLPLSALLRQLAEAMSTRAKVPIAVRLNGKGASDGADGADAAEPALPPAVKVVFYRVAQEALVNAAKYAKARAIRVQLRTRGAGKSRGTSIQGRGTPGTWSSIELAITDDGRGFDPSAITAGHFGLAIMRERADGVGATLAVRSQPGQGTQIVAAWRSEHGSGRAPHAERQAAALHQKAEAHG